MIQKINLPILLTIMCVLMAGVVGLAYVSKNKTNKTEEVKITRTDYSQTARKTLDWIDKQRGSDGWYILERGCDVTTKTCDTVWNNDEGNQDGLIATWVRFNFYNQTKDPKDLDIVKKDIDIFYNKYPNGVTNALWICKITYDMYQSNLFDQATKDKLEKICFNTQFPTPEEVKEYWTGGKDKELIKLSNIIDGWNSWDNYTLLLRGFDTDAAYPTDMLYRYKWKKQSNDLEIAKSYFSTIRQVYNEKNFGLENTCLLGLSSLDMVEFGLDKKSNMEFSTMLYNTTLASGENKRKFVNGFCGLFAKRLWKIEKDNTYLSSLEFNNRILTTFNLDGSSNKIVSDNGFFGSAYGNVSRFKSVVSNALVVESLRN